MFLVFDSSLDLIKNRSNGRKFTVRACVCDSLRRVYRNLHIVVIYLQHFYDLLYWKIWYSYGTTMWLHMEVVVA